MGGTRFSGMAEVGTVAGPHLSREKYGMKTESCKLAAVALGLFRDLLGVVSRI